MKPSFIKFFNTTFDHMCGQSVVTGNCVVATSKFQGAQAFFMAGYSTLEGMTYFVFTTCNLYIEQASFSHFVELEMFEDLPKWYGHLLIALSVLFISARCRAIQRYICCWVWILNNWGNNRFGPITFNWWSPHNATYLLKIHLIFTLFGIVLIKHGVCYITKLSLN